MSIDRAALVAGGFRFASGIAFLINPVRATKLWGDSDIPVGATRLLMVSMGYRDALLGGLLTAAALRGRDTRGWFLAAGGADAADLLGCLSAYRDLKRSQRLITLGFAAVGLLDGLWGATRRRPAGPRTLRVPDSA